MADFSGAECFRHAMGLRPGVRRPALGTIDASFYPLNVGNCPQFIDRYRALDGPGRAQVLKAALKRRDDYRLLAPNALQHYLVRHHEPGIGEAEFLRIVTDFMLVWRRQNGVE